MQCNLVSPLHACHSDRLDLSVITDNEVAWFLQGAHHARAVRLGSQAPRWVEGLLAAGVQDSQHAMQAKTWFAHHVPYV